MAACPGYQKGHRAACPGSKKDPRQPALVTKKEQGSLPWFLKRNKAACPDSPGHAYFGVLVTGTLLFYEYTSSNHQSLKYVLCLVVLDFRLLFTFSL